MKKLKKEVSIIIPCYNVEKYIKVCLDSIKEQLKNITYEIILIDDCSTDNTKDIIKKYLLSSDLNITLIENEENMGAGASRNKAIRVSKYDYISFIDADDYLSDVFYDEMLKCITNTNSDIVLCDISMVDELTHEITRYSTCLGEIEKENIINNGFAASPCNKIIKKELLLKYPFAEGIMNEDIPCIIAILINAKKVTYTSNVEYFYVQRNTSVQNTNLSNKRLDLIKALDLLKERIKPNKNYSLYMDMIIYNQIIKFIMYVPVKEKSLIKRAKFLRAFSKQIKNYNISNNQNYKKYISTKGKKVRMYYDTINKLLEKQHFLLASILMSIYNIYINWRNRNGVIKKNISMNDLIKKCKQNQKQENNKTLSVIIPNYNYATFLYERLYSVLNQQYKINEIIILDDCSSDNSIRVIDDIVDKLSKYMNISKYYNKKNSGSPFAQWAKGIGLAKSDYIWICEADDYCNKKMVKSLMNEINNNEDIVLAYVDTAYINKSGAVIRKTIKPEIDIMKTNHWESDYINNGIDEIKDYAFLNCTIANVSSVLFKNQKYLEILDKAKEYRQVGDYYFYLNVMLTGKVAFINKPYNYYRVHGNNVTSTTKKELHLKELMRVHEYLDKKIKLDKKQKQRIQERYEFLRKAWNLK